MIQGSQSSWYKMLALQSIVGGEEEEEEKRSQRPEFITTPQLWCLTKSDYK